MYASTNNDDELIDATITLSEDGCTAMAKNDLTNVRQVTIDVAHTVTYRTKKTIRQRGRNAGNTISTEMQRLINNITRDSKHVQFRRKLTITTFYNNDDAKMLTYDSGADGNYLRKKYRKNLGLPILCVSANKADVSNGGACNGKQVTKLTFPQFSNKVEEADTFEEFPTSLMIVGKTAEEGNVYILTREGVTVYKEEDVLIICQKKTILIGKRDKCRQYRITLTQSHGQWQPHNPTRKSKNDLQQTNSVYDLPSTE